MLLTVTHLKGLNECVKKTSPPYARVAVITNKQPQNTFNTLIKIFRSTDETPLKHWRNTSEKLVRHW